VTPSRNRELAKQSLVSRMQLDDSGGARALDRGAVFGGTRPGADRAQSILDYATVTAPISGRPSQLALLEGALVGRVRRHC
jgi:hypothetical protein